MKRNLVGVFCLFELISLLASSDEALNRLGHRLEERCILGRAATLRALSDHPILDLFLTNIRANQDAPETKSNDYLDRFIAASSRMQEYTQQLDQALNNNDMIGLGTLLQSTTSSAYGMNYHDRRLLWIMMDPAMIARLRAVDNFSVKLKMTEIFNCPSIALFATESPTAQ